MPQLTLNPQPQTLDVGQAMDSLAACCCLIQPLRLAVIAEVDEAERTAAEKNFATERAWSWLQGLTPMGETAAEDGEYVKVLNAITEAFKAAEENSRRKVAVMSSALLALASAFRSITASLAAARPGAREPRGLLCSIQAPLDASQAIRLASFLDSLWLDTRCGEEAEHCLPDLFERAGAAARSLFEMAQDMRERCSAYGAASDADEQSKLELGKRGVKPMCQRHLAKTAVLHRFETANLMCGLTKFTPH